MGVIRVGSNPFASLLIGDDLESIIQAVENIGITPEEPLEIQPITIRRGRQRPSVKPMDSSRPIGPKSPGSRKYRRYENTQQLLSMVGNEDVEEVTIYDFWPKTNSPFQMLLSDRENLKAWEDFINCSDEEQQKLLLRAQLRKMSSRKTPLKAHHSCSPKDCFQKIETKYRALLKKRQFPMGILGHLEDEVTSFFQQSPRSVYISQAANGFERLLLHAICQYLDLVSKSFDKEGTRQTAVKNPKDHFKLPPLLLTAYLKQTRCQ